MIISLQKFSKLQLLFFHQLIFLFFLPIFQCLQFVQQKTRVFQVTCNLEPVQDLNLRLNIEIKVIRLQFNQWSKLRLNFHISHQDYWKKTVKMGPFFEDKVLQKSKLSINFKHKSWPSSLLFLHVDSIDHLCWKTTLEIWFFFGGSDDNFGRRYRSGRYEKKLICVFD